jgi:hypothetical protein
MDQDVKNIQRSEYWKQQSAAPPQATIDTSRSTKSWRGQTVADNKNPIESPDWFRSLEECKSWGVNKSEEYRNQAYQFSYECKSEFSEFKERLW